MRLFAPVPALVLAVPLVLVACDAPTQPTDAVDGDPRRDPSSWPSQVGPEDRLAEVYTPAGADGSEDLPVVVVLHGYGASGSLQAGYFALTQRVDEAGFVLIVPDGTKDADGRRFWNATDACCDFGPTGVDDVGYLLGLLDQVQDAIPIDPDRVTVVGHSNGGFMSYRLACEASDRIAGIASVAGAGFADPADCDASEPVSVLQIHGTDDGTIRYEGGTLIEEDRVYPGAVDSASYWGELAGCQPQVDGERRDYVATKQGVDSQRSAWPDCQDATTSVALWTLEDTGHIPVFSDTFEDDLLQWLLSRRR